MAHLHAQGILHGDLYAHNILWNGRGDCLLGDFGAASFLPGDDAALARGLQRTEARAFGCLLEELLAHADGAGDPQSRSALLHWQTRCLHPLPAERPGFAEMAQSLADALTSALAGEQRHAA